MIDFSPLLQLCRRHGDGVGTADRTVSVNREEGKKSRILTDLPITTLFTQSLHNHEGDKMDEEVDFSK